LVKSPLNPINPYFQPDAQIVNSTAALSGPGAAAVLPLPTEAGGSHRTRATGNPPNAQLDIAGGTAPKRGVSHRDWKFLKGKTMQERMGLAMGLPDSVGWKRMETIGFINPHRLIIYT